MNKKVQNGTLKLTTKTWDKDTNGLFDYSTKTIKNQMKQFRIRQVLSEIILK